jgi:hypothetical protein
MIRDTHLSVPIYHPESSIDVLKEILATDARDPRSPFAQLAMQSTKRVSVWVHTTPETEAEIRKLVAQVKAFIRQRATQPDGSTIADDEIYVHDQTTGQNL